jgi:hypothetical protein
LGHQDLSLLVRERATEEVRGIAEAILGWARAQAGGHLTDDAAIVVVRRRGED